MSINILSPWHQAGGVLLVSPSYELRIVGISSPGLHTFNWTTSNQSLLSPSTCLSAAEAYLSIPVGCLSAGKTYVFSLGVDLGSEIGITKKVSHEESKGNASRVSSYIAA